MNQSNAMELTFDKWKAEVLKFLELMNCSLEFQDDAWAYIYKEGDPPAMVAAGIAAYALDHGFMNPEIPDDPKMPWRPGTRVIKAAYKQGDVAPLHATGTVKGSNSSNPTQPFYIILWDGMDGLNACVGDKLQKIEAE